MGKNADAINEGEAIALAAARLALKNRILVQTVGRGADFDAAEFVPIANEILAALALEASDGASHLGSLRRTARSKRTESRGTHDYRAGDVKNLKRRAKQSAGVAARLDQLADDPARVLAFIEEARDAAWHDVEQNLARTLDATTLHPENDPDYERMRAARMQALAQVDLQALEVQQKARRLHAAQADIDAGA